MSVADFYRQVMGILDALGIEVEIFPQPVEVPDPIQPFPEDTGHASYDAASGSRCRLVLDFEVERLGVDCLGIGTTALAGVKRVNDRNLVIGELRVEPEYFATSQSLRRELPLFVLPRWQGISRLSPGDRETEPVSR